MAKLSYQWEKEIDLVTQVGISGGNRAELTTISGEFDVVLLELGSFLERKEELWNKWYPFSGLELEDM